VKPRIIERASPAHRVWQMVGWAILIVGILVLAKGQPNYRLLLMSNAAALSVAILGLNLVVGFSGQISLGHSAFFGFGGYTAAVLIVDHDWPFLATLPVAAVFGGVLGFILGLPALRIRGLYLALVTLALAIVFPSIAKIDQLNDLTGGANGKPVPVGWHRPSWFPLKVTQQGWQFLVLAALAGLLFYLASNMVRSRAGRALVSLRDNEIGATVSGVYPAGWKTGAFAISAAYASMAGAMLTLAIPIVAPDTGGFVLAIQLITGLVLGGIGIISGSVVGALAIVWLPELTRSWGKFLPLFSENKTALLANAAYGILLIAMMFVMPGGIMWFVRFARSKFVRFVPRLPKVSSLDEDIEVGPISAATVQQTQGGSA